MVKIYHIILLLFLSTAIFSQTVQQLELKKEKNQAEIKQLNKQLKLARKNTDVSFKKYIIIKRKVNLRRRSINLMRQQFVRIEKDIEDTKKEIIEIKEKLKTFQKVYAKMIRNAYKYRSSYNKLMFILSSDSFNKAYKRLMYLNKYTENRKEQMIAIKLEAENLEKKIGILTTEKQRKYSLLQNIEIESRKLEKERVEQKKELKKLKSKESIIKKNLSKKKAIAKNLRSKISNVIKIEANKNSIDASKTTNEKLNKMRAADKIISSNFSSNKGRLPWPTYTGSISDTYGKHKHPVFNVYTENDGIDITTGENNKVRSVFNGTVTGIFVIPGANKTITIKHGNYFSVYSNLSEVYVSKGNDVKTKQLIGKIATDDDSSSTLKFQIWKGLNKTNPQNWLVF